MNLFLSDNIVFTCTNIMCDICDLSGRGTLVSSTSRMCQCFSHIYYLFLHTSPCLCPSKKKKKCTPCRTGINFNTQE